ncbi:hypothetical protein [Croceicoccus sp. YJ47]|uniref:hypothetical protein n=1 Tax=Croceicoccus sp. YJ47 TaxID=2798724 RepID=UPI001F459665|nr:hypothetical protein [Croceicoccus sp. YJ47]
MGWEADSEKASLSGMRRACFVILFSLGVITSPATASELERPARFCGYSPIIDVRPGEKITTLQGGIHGGSFRWDGDFGSIVVRGIGWASRPNGRLVMQPAEGRPGQFAQQRKDGKYVIAIWNGRQGTAYFESSTRFTVEQRAAIERVRLFQEGEEPSDCDLRTVFVWSTDQ